VQVARVGRAEEAQRADRFLLTERRLFIVGSFAIPAAMSAWRGGGIVSGSVDWPQLDWRHADLEPRVLAPMR
jgi:hypothetical protein